jgi:hypothetical protein
LPGLPHRFLQRSVLWCQTGVPSNFFGRTATDILYGGTVVPHIT